jgi:hypothetical protein
MDLLLQLYTEKLGQDGLVHTLISGIITLEEYMKTWDYRDLGCRISTEQVMLIYP